MNLYLLFSVQQWVNSIVDQVLLKFDIGILLVVDYNTYLSFRVVVRRNKIK